MPLAPLVDPGPPLTREEIARFSRHLLLEQVGELGQRRLRAARVLIVGAGALGAPTLQYLAAAGVGTLGIVDDDVVDVTNLQRQVIHSAADVGRPKVDSAIETVTGISPDITVIPHRERLTAANAAEVFDGYDLVLDGADNFPTRYLVSDAAAAAGIPVVWGSILRFDAQVSGFWASPRAGDDAAPAPEGVTLRDLFPVPPPPGSTPSCGQAGVMGALPGQVGSLMASEAIKLVLGSGEPLLGRIAVIDALAPSVTVLPLRARAASSDDARAVREDPARRGYLLPAEEAAGLTLEAACAQPRTMDTTDRNETVPEMTVTDLQAALAARDGDTARDPAEAPLLVLDVREDTERTIGVIPDDVHVPLAVVLDDPAAVADEHGLRDARVAVYCRSGARSHSASMALRAAGVEAINVTGGILAWRREIDPSIPEY